MSAKKVRDAGKHSTMLFPLSIPRILQHEQQSDRQVAPLINTRSTGAEGGIRSPLVSVKASGTRVIDVPRVDPDQQCQIRGQKGITGHTNLAGNSRPLFVSVHSHTTRIALTELQYRFTTKLHTEVHVVYRPAGWNLGQSPFIALEQLDDFDPNIDIWRKPRSSSLVACMLLLCSDDTHERRFIAHEWMDMTLEQALRTGIPISLEYQAAIYRQVRDSSSSCLILNRFPS